MGQKVNPISFRSAEKLSLQNILWTTHLKNNNYSLLNTQDLEIEKIIKKL